MKKAITISALIAAALLATNALAEQQYAAKQSKNSGQESSSSHQGTKVSFSQLPQPVQKAMRSQAGNLNLENIQKLDLDGQTGYQASFDKGSLKGKITVGEDGSLLRYQESAQLALIEAVPKIDQTGMSLSDLPQAVQQAVKQQASTNQVGDISKTSQSGQTLYHAAYNDSGIHTELFLDQDGKVVMRADESALYAAPLQNSQNASLASAPKEVQDALREHGATASNVTDIDKGTWQGKTAYRALVNKNGSVKPIVVSEDGHILQRQTSSAGAPATTEKSQGSQGQSQSQSSQSQSQRDNRPQSSSNK